MLSDRETYLYALWAACGTVTPYRSHDLRSPEARLYLPDARQLQLQLDEQELDFSAFSKELGLEVASQKITLALKTSSVSNFGSCPFRKVLTELLCCYKVLLHSPLNIVMEEDELRMRFPSTSQMPTCSDSQSSESSAVSPNFLVHPRLRQHPRFPSCRRMPGASPRVRQSTS